MDIRFAGKDARKLNIRLTLVAGALGLSVATNLVLAVLYSTSRTTILVPTLPEQVEVRDGGVVGRDYMMRVVRDLTYLMLNRSPETAPMFDRQVKTMVEPATYDEIRKRLAEGRRERDNTKTAQAFWPDDFFTDPAKLYAEVRGTLQITNGSDVIDTQRKIYAIQLVRRGAMLRMLTFNEITPEASRAEKLRPTTLTELQSQ